MGSKALPVYMDRQVPVAGEITAVAEGQDVILITNRGETADREGHAGGNAPEGILPALVVVRAPVIFPKTRPCVPGSQSDLRTLQVGLYRAAGLETAYAAAGLAAMRAARPATRPSCRVHLQPPGIVHGGNTRVVTVTPLHRRGESWERHDYLTWSLAASGNGREGKRQGVPRNPRSRTAGNCLSR